MKKIPVFPRRFIFLSAMMALSASSQSAPPGWWSEGNQPAVDLNAEQNNHGPANIGQAKWMAKSALHALRVKYPAVASQVESNLVGPGKIIQNWSPPYDQASRDGNHAPLLIGQLKALAAPFYDTLHNYEPTWLESQLVANQTKDAANPTNYYPWTLSITDDQNNAPATVGQLKAAFSLRFSEFPDSDSDGIPDSWESTHCMNSQDASDSLGDLDGDGLTNWEEFLLGTDPNLADTDGDGDPDGNDPDSYGTESDSTDSPEVADPTAPPEQLYLNFVHKGYGEHYFEQDIYYESDIAPDHFEISTKTTMKSTVNRVYDNIYETLLYRMPSSESSVLGGCKQKAFPRFEEIDNLLLEYSRAEAPMLIPYALCGFGEISFSEPFWSYEEGGGAAKSILVRMERRKTEVCERSRTFLKVYRQHGESMALADGEVIGVEAAVLTIPGGATKSNAIKLEVDSAGKTCSLLPMELTAHRRGTIAAPGAAIPRAGGNEVYEVVTLENADYDESEWQPTSMADGAQEDRQDGETDVVSRDRDDDFVNLRFSCPLTNMAGSSEIVFDQAGQGERMQEGDIRFHNSNGMRVQLSALRIDDLNNPSGPLAPAFTGGGLDLFVEIGDLGEITGQSTQANSTSRKYADLIWKITVGGTTIEQKVRIFRGGFWRCDRTGNSGTIALYDGKGRKPDGTIDYGQIVKGPYQIKTGQEGHTDESVPDVGPTPMGWYGIYARNRGNNNTDMRTTWLDSARPQTNHHLNSNGSFLGYVQQGSYCQWVQAGNHNIPGKGAYGYDNGNDSAPYDGMPASIHFKFQLVEIGEFTNRTDLQIHPDGFRDGTAGCVGVQAHDDCCKVLFLARHYFQTRILVD